MVLTSSADKPIIRLSRLDGNRKRNTARWHGQRRFEMRVFWAATHIGGTVGSGEFLAESWEDAGFSVDSEGDPTHDCNHNTISKFYATDFDSTNPDHVTLACDFATSDGCTNRVELHDYLTSEFGLSIEQIESEIGEWIDANQ